MECAVHVQLGVTVLLIDLSALLVPQVMNVAIQVLDSNYVPPVIMPFKVLILLAPRALQAPIALLYIVPHSHVHQVPTLGIDLQVAQYARLVSNV